MATAAELAKTLRAYAGRAWDAVPEQNDFYDALPGRPEIPASIKAGVRNVARGIVPPEAREQWGGIAQAMVPDPMSIMRGSEQSGQAMMDGHPLAASAGLAGMALGAIDLVPGGGAANVAGRALAGAVRKAPPLNYWDSKMARAKEMGFNVDLNLYRGDVHDYAEYDLKKTGSSSIPRSGTNKGIWLTDSPEEAGTFAKMASNVEAGREALLKYPNRLSEYFKALETGQHIKPMFARMKNPLIDDVGGRLSTNSERVRKLIKQAEINGNDGIILKNVRSSDPDQAPTNHYLVFDPKNVRSRFAAFDPKKRNSRDLLASAIGTLGLGAAATAGNTEGGI